VTLGGGREAAQPEFRSVGRAHFGRAVAAMIDPYAQVRAHFEQVAGVTVNSGRGAQGLKVGKKMIAMFSKGDLLLKLPPSRVEELVAAGRGLPYDPGTGKVLANYVVIPASKKRSWIALCQEAAAAAG